MPLLTEKAGFGTTLNGPYAAWLLSSCGVDSNACRMLCTKCLHFDCAMIYPDLEAKLQFKMEGQYRYASLKRPGQIRLLGLLPSKQGKAPIQCRLFNHSLGGKVGEQHPFEALSYVWGSPEKKCSIIIESSTLHITSNLHTALSHLRHSSIERLLWVDAVCINQTDDREKEQQIGLMYEIYSCANCVLVWLGEETKDVNSSLEELRLAGSRRASSSSYEEQVQENVIKLLQRPWFRRIWVSRDTSLLT